MNVDCYFSFISPIKSAVQIFLQVWEWSSTGMCKCPTISSRALFVRVISLLQALWLVHRTIFSHLAFQHIIEAMQFKKTKKAGLLPSRNLWSIPSHFGRPVTAPNCQTRLPHAQQHTSLHCPQAITTTNSPTAEMPESRYFSPFTDTRAFSSTFTGHNQEEGYPC